jgi:coenzyme F420-dependent glucose-6-phosphate dehydrogenase
MCAQEVDQPEDLLDQALLAEEAGFDGIVTPDAFQPWSDDGAAGFSWSWLGAVAARTTRIRMIVTVTSALHRYHPALLAQASATLDRLSRGRFVLGMGTGLPIHERPFGLPSVPTGERIERMKEAAVITRRLLDGETVTGSTGHHRLEGAHLYSPPTHGVPIWIAANGPISASAAGEVGDGLITSVKDVPTTSSRIIDPYRRAAPRRGVRDAPVLATRWCILANDEVEAWQALGSLRGLRVSGSDQAVSPYELRRQAEVMDRAEVLGRFALVSDMEGLLGVYRPLVMDLGADWVALQVRSLDSLETIRLAGEIVLPALRGAIAPEGTSADPMRRRNDLTARMDSRSTGGGDDGDTQN